VKNSPSSRPATMFPHQTILPMTRIRPRHALQGLLKPLLLGLFGCALAAPVVALDEDVIATVNGEPVKESVLQAVMQQFRGQQQTPDDAQIVTELVNMSLLAQLATEAGLHEGEDVQSLLELQRMQLLANAYMGKLSEESQPDRQTRVSRQPDFAGVGSRSARGDAQGH